jgi:hypothetical protein
MVKQLINKGRQGERIDPFDGNSRGKQKENQEEM